MVSKVPAGFTQIAILRRIRTELRSVNPPAKRHSTDQHQPEQISQRKFHLPILPAHEKAPLCFAGPNLPTELGCNRVQQLLYRPNVVGQSTGHRWSRLEGFVRAAEIEVSEVESQRPFVVRPLLPEAVSQPAHTLREAAD